MTFDELRAAWQADLRERIAEHVVRLGWSGEQLRAHQRSRLQALLAHAIERSPFHRSRLAGVDPATFELADLPRLPVMTKAEMMERFGEVVTDRALSRDVVERALAATQRDPVPIHGRYIAMASGGSSGCRGVFVSDLPAFGEFIGSLSRSLAARIPPGARVAISMVCAASAVHATVAAPAFTIGAGLPFEFATVPVTRPLGEIVARLNTLNTPLLYGYPTMLARLAAERRAGRLRIQPLAISSTSETLHPELRAAIRDGFGCPIVDTFGSTEGLVGTTAPDDPVLVFNSDVCLVEIEPARVLVTNLANHVQPLIRYELTDVFVQQPSEGFLRATVHGRSDDVLQFDHVAVHPHAIRAVLVKTPEVLDYQLKQTQRGVEIVALTDDDAALDVAGVCRRVASALAEAGLENPEVRLTVATSLSRDDRTGKLQRVVPLSC